MVHPVVHEHTVQWGEMDALGHVNNTRFFAWLESARIALARQVALYDDSSDIVPVLATTSCDFLRPVVFPVTVCVGVKVTTVGASSVGMAYDVWRKGDPDALFARATSVLVMVSRATMQKAAIPDDIRAKLSALQ